MFHSAISITQNTEFAAVAMPFRTLVLEDSEFDALRLRRDLRAIDPTIQLTVAKTCAEFEDLATSRQFDAIIVDYFVPDGDGLSALKAISDQVDLSRLVAIMIVGVYQEGVAADAEALGCFAYLTKSELKVDRLRSLLFHQPYAPKTEFEADETCTAESHEPLCAAQALENMRPFLKRLSCSSQTLQSLSMFRSDDALTDTGTEIAFNCACVSEILKQLDQPLPDEFKKLH